MAYSKVSYTQQTNGNRTFTVPFPYIDRDDLHVTVDTTSAPFTWHSDTIIQLDTAPPVGATVTLSRLSEIEKRLVTYSDGSTLTGRDLDLADTQGLFLAQETRDIADATFSTADEAMGLASDALREAEGARTQADNAVALAGVATETANEAHQVAQDARQKAGEAQQAADNAANSADNAHEAANRAADAAKNAQNTVDSFSETIDHVMDVFEANQGTSLDNITMNADNLSKLTDKAAARANLGLDRVDNTPDADKPVSVPVAAALEGMSSALSERLEDTATALRTEIANTNTALQGYVPTDRTLSTTAPLQGGGNLTANRTLSILAASESQTGAVQLATDAEAKAGTLKTKAVHPAGLKAALATVSVANGTESVVGAVQLATAAETLAGTLRTKAATPYSIANMGKKLAATGYARLPGGLILQWGSFTLNTKEENTKAFTFPLAFPTLCCSIWFHTANDEPLLGLPWQLTKTSFTVRNYSIETGKVKNGGSHYWTALGY